MCVHWHREGLIQIICSIRGDPAWLYLQTKLHRDGTSIQTGMGTGTGDSEGDKDGDGNRETKLPQIDGGFGYLARDVCPNRDVLCIIVFRHCVQCCANSETCSQIFLHNVSWQRWSSCSGLGESLVCPCTLWI